MFTFFQLVFSRIFFEKTNEKTYTKKTIPLQQPKTQLQGFATAITWVGKQEQGETMCLPINLTHGATNRSTYDGFVWLLASFMHVVGDQVDPFGQLGYIENWSWRNVQSVVSWSHTHLMQAGEGSTELLCGGRWHELARVLDKPS